MNQAARRRGRGGRFQAAPIVVLAGLLALPFVDLAVLLKLWALTDWQVPLLAVIVMAGAGIALVGSLGWLTVRQFRQERDRGVVPERAILDTCCLLVAGRRHEAVDDDAGGMAFPMPPNHPPPSPPEADSYVERGLLVYTAAFHLKRGSCCGSGCRHCPYEPTPPPSQICSCGVSPAG